MVLEVERDAFVRPVVSGSRCRRLVTLAYASYGQMASGPAFSAKQLVGNIFHLSSFYHALLNDARRTPFICLFVVVQKFGPSQQKRRDKDSYRSIFGRSLLHLFCCFFNIKRKKLIHTSPSACRRRNKRIQERKASGKKSTAVPGPSDGKRGQKCVIL